MVSFKSGWKINYLYRTIIQEEIVFSYNIIMKVCSGKSTKKRVNKLKILLIKINKLLTEGRFSRKVPLQH